MTEQLPSMRPPVDGGFDRYDRTVEAEAIDAQVRVAFGVSPAGMPRGQLPASQVSDPQRTRVLSTFRGPSIAA
jgi:hypothetical protein